MTNHDSETNPLENTKTGDTTNKSLISKLRESLEKLESNSLERDEAVAALETSASLIYEEALPDEANHDRLTKLFSAAAQKSLDSFKSPATIKQKYGDQEGAEISVRTSLVRGVTLNLDKKMRLLSITVTPAKVKQRQKLLSFVGKGHDTANDVSVRHDDYIAEQNPHAST